MLYLLNAMLFVGAIALILGVGLVAKAFLQDRKVESDPLRGYFSLEYDRDLLQQSAFNETEDGTTGTGTQVCGGEGSAWFLSEHGQVPYAEVRISRPS